MIALARLCEVRGEPLPGGRGSERPSAVGAREARDQGAPTRKGPTELPSSASTMTRDTPWPATPDVRLASASSASRRVRSTSAACLAPTFGTISPSARRASRMVMRPFLEVQADGAHTHEA